MNRKIHPIGYPPRNLIIHTIAWILYILYEVSILLYISPASINWLETILAFVVNITVFYISADYLLLNFGNSANYFLAITSLLALVAIYLGLSYVLYAQIFPLIEGKQAAVTVLTKLFIAQHIWRGVYFIGLSAGYWFVRKSVDAEKKLRLLEKEQYMNDLKEQELKREIAAANLAFIKAQINPHFLHNTLNFFYSNIYPLSKPLAQSVLLLSRIMRFTFRPEEKDGMVALSLELEHIRNYIELNKLRFSNKLYVELRVVGDYEHVRILSFVLMTLVENAIKYGDLTDEENPLEINLMIDSDQLNFSVRNKKKRFIPDFETSGIGVSNIRKQLYLVYQGKALLDIKDDIDFYKSTLTINI